MAEVLRDQSSTRTADAAITPRGGRPRGSRSQSRPRHGSRHVLAAVDRQRRAGDETGVIVADRYGGAVVRRAETAKMPAATRRVQTVRFARYAANRLRRFEDPPV